MKIAKETWIVAAIGLADLMTTIVFIQQHNAAEANPLFRFFWEMGLPTFIIAKLILLVCPLLILEWARTRRPRTVILALRFSILAYVGLYGVGVYRLNHSEHRELAMAQAPIAQADHTAEITFLPAASKEFVAKKLKEARLRPDYWHPVHRPTLRKTTPRGIAPVELGQPVKREIKPLPLPRLTTD